MITETMHELSRGMNMNPISTRRIFKTLRNKLPIASVLSFVFILSTLAGASFAQGSQLTLADILIGLRSKKVTLPERNQILTDAVLTRGTTFAITPEIEKELATTGADKALIAAIRMKGQAVKIASVNPPPVETKKAEPPPPDFAFYEKRADASLAKGDLDAAVVDYTKAIEMNGTSPSAYLSRANVHLAKKSWDLAIADLSRVVELNPKNAAAFAKRADALENKGYADLAEADYNKAFELDPSNETAKASAARLQTEREKAAAAKAEAEKAKAEPVKAAPVVVAPPPLPEFVDLGQLAEASAVRMVKPTYSQVASRSNIGGKVVVNVEMDVEGNVVSATDVSGHQLLRHDSETAARRSKFKPAMIGDKAIKSKGFIVYNFTTRQ
jgi:tetratricopeptide (TPR) repeat protein